MDGWFGYLLLAGLFFLMMRFGCGSHMGRGGHKGHGGHEDGHDATHKDPVCGMDIDPKEGYGKMHQGQLHRFCSRDCLDKFEDNPERYLGTEGGPEGGKQ